MKTNQLLTAAFDLINSINHRPFVKRNQYTLKTFAKSVFKKLYTTKYQILPNAFLFGSSLGIEFAAKSRRKLGNYFRISG